jgi:hypothetical protein
MEYIPDFEGENAMHTLHPPLLPFTLFAVRLHLYHEKAEQARVTKEETGRCDPEAENAEAKEHNTAP